MTPVDIGGILVAVVAAFGAWAAQRAAARASKVNTTVSGRLDAEKSAYERARAFDTETIIRQDKEIDELRTLNKKLEIKVQFFKTRLARLEDISPSDLERQLRERLEEHDE